MARFALQMGTLRKKTVHTDCVLMEIWQGNDSRFDL
jgi:hypothetical protein